MKKYLKEIKELQELKELLSSRNLPEFIIVEGNNDLGEFFKLMVSYLVMLNFWEISKVG